ncbi:hypothetical protein NKJ73_21515 [Mesorhizobium sp. M0074]|uniref:hypothetical protein n=3 Tax=Mesorhizobium TaxID=68287 RepID=UPI00333A07FC
MPSPLMPMKRAGSLTPSSTGCERLSQDRLIVSNPETDQRRRNLTLKPKDNIDDLQQLCSQGFKRLQTLTTPTFAIAAWMMTAASISWGKHSRQGVLPDGRDQARGYLEPSPRHRETRKRQAASSTGNTESC